MFGVAIMDRDPNGVLTLDLKDILRLIGREAQTAEWLVSDVEVLDGEAATELEDLADRGLRIPGQVLVRLSEQVGQVINGCFQAYREHMDKPWIVIRAVDSSAFDVQTDSEALVTQIRQRFKNVVNLPTAGE
jgi:hypothetical protein